jgi:hypothetical protein
VGLIPLLGFYVGAQYEKVNEIVSAQTYQIDSLELNTQHTKKENMYKEKDIVGSWSYHVPDTTNILQLRFDIENGRYIFKSFINDRPEFLNCTWRIESDQVTIECDEYINHFYILSLTKKNMVVVENKEPKNLNNPIVYTKNPSEVL